MEGEGDDEEGEGGGYFEGEREVVARRTFVVVVVGVD